MKSKHLLLMLLLALLAPWAANAQSPLFSEDFESGSMPTGWTTDGSGSWSVSTGDYSSSTGAGQGSYNAKIAHGNTGDATKLITPEIDLSSVASAELSFMHVQRSWAGDIDGLKVYYRTSSSGTWTLLEEYTSAYASWTTEEGIVLPNLSSTYQVAFEYIDHYGYGVGVDNVIITQPSSCAKPSTLTATAPYGYDAAHCILLQWEDGSGSYNVQLKKASESEEQWQLKASGVSLLSMLFNDLDPLTTYNARVQSVCGGDVSDWKTVNFTTACGAINVPQTFTFENDATSAMPDCWLRHPSNTGVYVSSSSSNAHNGSKYLTFNSGSNRYVALPEINIPATGFKVNFWTRPEDNTSSSCATFQVGYITNDDFSTFQMVEEYAYNDWASATHMEKTVYMPDIPTGGRIAFYHTGTSWYYWYLDDITVTAVPTCYKPTEAHAEVADANNATISWTPDPLNAAGGSYSILDAELNVVPGADQLTGTSFSLSGLNPETDYTYYVRTNCFNSEEDVNVELVEVSFSTPADCAAPVLEADAFTNVSAHQATVSWTGFTSNTAYIVRYRTAEYLDGITEDFNETSSLPTGWAQYTAVLDNVLAGTATLSSGSSWSRTSYGLGAYNWKINVWNTKNAWMVTPSVTVPANGALSFDVALTAYNGDGAPSSGNMPTANSRFVVLVSNSDLATWTILREWNNTGSSDVLNDISNTGNTFSVDLSAYENDNVRVAFYIEHSGSGDSDFHLDNVAIGTTIPAGIWQTVSPNPTTTSTTLTDLTADTPYEVKVNGICTGTQEETGSAIQSFTTTIACPQPNTLTVAANADDPTIKEDLTWVMTGAETDWQLCLNGDEENLIDINESEVSINPTTHVVSYTLSGLIPGQDYTVKVRANCEASVPGDQTSDWSNTQNFQTEATCVEPTDFAHGTVDAHNAPLSWTEAGAATQWQICINDDMDNLILISNTTTGVTVEGQNVSYTLTGLTAETAYTVKLRAYCDDGDGNQSPWETTSFTTLVACPAPTNLQVEANALDATFSWEGEAGSYEVVTSMNSSDNPSDLVSTPVTGNDYLFTNLELGNHYFWVRSNCSANGEGYSTWAGPVSVHIGYCVPNPTSHDGSGITGVTFGMGSNVVENGDGTTSLPASSPFYGDYSSMIGAVQAGVESTISITTATGTYPYTFVIWVDLDNSLSFEDSEVLYVGKAASGVGTHTATITIPATQATGDYRMRIYGADSYFSNFYNNGSTNWEAAHDPCATGTYRHAHDYTVRVLEAPSCLTPTNVEVTYTGGTSATIGWTGDAEAWNMRVNGVDVNGVITNPYTLTGLELATTYSVEVQANCGANGTSEWSTPVSFTTDFCMPENMCEITFELTDTYGDGWNGNYISVVDVLTNTEFAQLTNEDLNGTSGSGENELNTINLPVCDGREIQFQYHIGVGNTYPEENSWVIKDVNDEIVWEGQGSDGESDQNYTVSCAANPCKTPKNLTVDNIESQSAELSWEGFASNYNVRYRTAEILEPVFTDDFEDGLDQWTILHGDDATAAESGYWYTINPTSGLSFESHSATYCASSWSWSNSAYQANNYLVTPQVELGGKLKFWVRTNATYPDSYEVLLSTTGNTIEDFTVTLQAMAEAPNNGEWNEVVIDLSSYSGNGYIAIHHQDYDKNYLLIDDFEVFSSNIIPAGEWVNATANGNNTEITGLDPATTYDWQVQANCGSTDGESEWSAIAQFTTANPSFTKSINANSWYAISSPVNMPAVTAVENLTDGNYDFYRYNEASSTWENYKADHSDFTTFENGRGYIYRRDGNKNLTFTGVPNTAASYPYLLTTDGAGDLKGFNLLGNPFANPYTYSGNCYALTEKGTWMAMTNYTISVCEAVLVKVSSAVNYPYLSTKSAPKAVEALAFTVSGNGYEDVTYAMLEEGEGLTKVAHLATEAPALSIPVDGSNYAIAYLGYEVESFPLTLNAQAGEYTIALNNQISGLSYCHLLDKETGKETDLLKGAYTFKANGNSNRFTVLLNASLENGEIAIWNGNSWIVNGEGTLQVFDVMGRRVYNQEVAGQSSLNTDELATGVYVIRLGEKSQKIVVK